MPVRQTKYVDVIVLRPFGKDSAGNDTKTGERAQLNRLAADAKVNAGMAKYVEQGPKFEPPAMNGAVSAKSEREPFTGSSTTPPASPSKLSQAAAKDLIEAQRSIPTLESWYEAENDAKGKQRPGVLKAIEDRIDFLSGIGSGSSASKPAAQPEQSAAPPKGKVKGKVSG